MIVLFDSGDFDFLFSKAIKNSIRKKEIHIIAIYQPSSINLDHFFSSNSTPNNLS